MRWRSRTSSALDPQFSRALSPVRGTGAAQALALAVRYLKDGKDAVADIKGTHAKLVKLIPDDLPQARCRAMSPRHATAPCHCAMSLRRRPARMRRSAAHERQPGRAPSGQEAERSRPREVYGRR